MAGHRGRRGRLHAAHAARRGRRRRAARPRPPRGRARLCPKCRQPLEGDEEYVCCAAATLTWKCQDCAKVSEGFAFPYGMCPACGGKLAVAEPAQGGRRGRARGDPHRLRDRAGRHGLLRARRAGGDRPDAPRALRPLRRDGEGAHGDALAPLPRAGAGRRRRSRSTGPPSTPASPNRPEDPANLFRIAIAFEERAVKFFTERGAAVADGLAGAAALPGAGGRGAGARRPAHHRAQALAGRQAGADVARRRLGAARLPTRKGSVPRGTDPFWLTDFGTRRDAQGAG